MTTPLMPTPDPKLDLQFERIIDVPRELVWEAWTTPAHLLKWFTPAPWRTTECEIDLRPGGMFRTVMCSPEGELFPGMGSYVEVVPNERLIWTNALLPGFRPNVLKEGDSCHDLAFTTHWRGYQTASLGPVDPQYPDTYLGGTSKAVINAELLFPFPGLDKSFRFGPFFDAGNVFTSNYTYAKEGLAMSAGLTGTWVSPLGPLKFSFGQPINQVTTAKLQKFQFQMGTNF